MRIALAFVLISVAILFSECRIQSNGAQGYRPKKANFFKYQGKAVHLTDCTLIDTNAVYITSFALYTEDMSDSMIGWCYKRFFSSGQFYTSPVLDSLPSLADVNNIKWGFPGYFKFTNKNNTIKMEFIELINGGQRGVEWARLENGNILTYGHNAGGGIFPEGRKTEKWEKMIVPGMTYTKPDW